MAGQKGRSGGHNRKTLEKHKAEGTYRDDRHGNRAEAQIKPSALKAPERFGPVALQTWNDIVETIPESMITKLDYKSLVAYCDLCAAYDKLQRAFEDDPIDKDIRISYLSVIQNMDRLGRQFGWTPQSRAALTLTPDKEDEDDPMESLTARLVG